ncbi:MAG: hypothetical protein Kow0031_30570 [Anaerolineae bacterium]
MVDSNTRQAIDYVVRGAVRAELHGTVARPNTLPLLDWRQTFFVRRAPGGDVTATVEHRLPADPQPGEVWRIPLENYGDGGKRITVKVEQLTYQWEGQKGPTGTLEGWHLNVYVECVRWPQ